MSQTALAADRGDFMRVSGSRFILDDKPFYFVGANLNVMHGHRARSQLDATFEAARKDGLRVGRIWALGEGIPEDPEWKARDILFRRGPHGWSPHAYRQLDRVIAAAAKAGIYLVITLSNRWADYGGIPMYLKWRGHKRVGRSDDNDHFYQDKQIRSWYLDHVHRIVSRTNQITGIPYAQDPTIFAWETQNELGGSVESAPLRRKWFVSVARSIRAHDPNHLIVAGTIGYDLQSERQSWQRMCALPETSYCDQHVYPQRHALSKGRNLSGFIDDRIQLAHHVVEKPIVFSEFGFSTSQRDARERAELHDSFLQRIFHGGANGAMVWIYQPTLHWKRPFSILIDGRRDGLLRGVLRRHAASVTRFGAANENSRIAPAQGNRPLARTHFVLHGVPGYHEAWVKKSATRECLALAVDRFHHARFEEAGVWRKGVLIHFYGRRTGHLTFRFQQPRSLKKRTFSAVDIRARISSEFPGQTAPVGGISIVEAQINGHSLGVKRVPADDGRGAWVSWTAPTSPFGRRRRPYSKLTFRVAEGAHSNGLTLYGRSRGGLSAEDSGPLELCVTTEAADSASGGSGHSP